MLSTLDVFWVWGFWAYDLEIDKGGTHTQHLHITYNAYKMPNNIEENNEHY